MPQSGSRYAVFNSETRAITASPVSAITVKNAGSGAKSLTLSRFYYGCGVASQGGLAGVPVSCVMVATAKNADGEVVATQKFPYQSTSSMQGMALATPDPAKFRNVYTVEFSLSPPSDLESRQLGDVIEDVVGVLDIVLIQTCS